MDKAALIRALVNDRVFVYRSTYGDKGFVVYEKLAEEGDEVKKQIGRFTSEKNARAFMKLFRDELTKYFEELITVQFKEGVVKPIADTVNKKLWGPVATDDPELKRGHNPAEDPY